jgi:hypothetical protein
MLATYEQVPGSGLKTDDATSMNRLQAVLARSAQPFLLIASIPYVSLLFHVLRPDTKRRLVVPAAVQLYQGLLATGSTGDSRACPMLHKIQQLSSLNALGNEGLRCGWPRLGAHADTHLPDSERRRQQAALQRRHCGVCPRFGRGKGVAVVDELLRMPKHLHSAAKFRHRRSRRTVGGIPLFAGGTEAGIRGVGRGGRQPSDRSEQHGTVSKAGHRNEPFDIDESSLSFQ